MAASLYLFNPDNDLALANNNENYQAPQSARQMADDLCTLPAWFAAAGDSVMVNSIGEAERWQREETGGLLTDVHWHSFRATPFVGNLKPWGWNPALVKRLRQWGVGEAFLPSAAQMETIRRLSSREQAVQMLSKLLASLRGFGQSLHEQPITSFPQFAPSSSSCNRAVRTLSSAISSPKLSEQFSRGQAMKPLPDTTPSSFCGESFFCTELKQVEQLVCQWKETLLKAPYSGSGKGLRQGRGVWTPVLENWCSRVLNGQGGVVVEPLYNKVEDFAMEFLVEGNEVSFAGYSLFRTDGNGAYKGNLLATDEEIEQWLSCYVERTALRALREEWLQTLREWLCETDYRGYLGIDMMMCRFAEAPTYRMHPCVEINLRMNMGVVARLFHDRFVKEDCTGTFTVEYWQDAEALRADHLWQKADSPLVVSEGRILSGYLSLNPITKGCHYRASVKVNS